MGNSSFKEKSITYKSSTYGSIGLAVFLIFFGMSYIFPKVFPEGSMFIVAGVLILFVNLVKLLKNLDWGWIEILFGIVFLISGLNKVLKLEVGFVPVFITILGIFYLFKNIKKLNSG